MKEIVVLAGLLCVVFLFLWCIVVSMEFFVKRGKEKKVVGKRKEEGEKVNIVPVIVASIAAYEEEEKGRRKKGERHLGKREGISWWRVSGRVK